LRLERGSTSELLVSPLVDPDDPNSAVLIRFKQGDSSFDASTRVRHESFKVLESAKQVCHFPGERLLEVNVPTA